MNKIVTVTLNPSLDETIITQHLNIGYYNHVAASKHLDASGRGVNVSRAVDRLEAPTHAIIVLGNDAVGSAYKGLISQETFPTKIIRYTGETRSDTIIVDTGGKTETHIVDEDTVGPRDDVQTLIEALKQVIEADDMVVLAGVPPRDTPSTVYAQLIDTAHEIGASAAVMTGGEPLKQALRSAPESVVLMQREVESLFNYPVRTIQDMKSSGKKLQEFGCKQVIIVMNEYEEILLVDEETTWLADIADLQFTGTDSGVVDAMLAGYLVERRKGKSLEDSLTFGAAALAYAAQQIGNKFAAAHQLADFMENISVQNLEVDQAQV